MPFSLPNRLPKLPGLRRPKGQSKAPSPTPTFSKLQPDGTYPCPICRHGTVSPMPLMETFGCDFCRHIFSPNFTEQVLRVEDSAQPLRWQWQGKKWRPARYTDPTLNRSLWLMSGAIALVPPLLIGGSQYLFPPLPGSALSPFPQLWLGAAILTHPLIASWILLEHHQPTRYVSWKVQSQDWITARLNSLQRRVTRPPD